MFLIHFNGNLFQDNITVIAKFEGNFVGKNKDSRQFHERLKTKDVLKVLIQPNFIDFWYKILNYVSDEIEIVFEDDCIIDESFEKLYYIIQLKELDIYNLLFHYSKNIGNCFAIIEDDVLLDIVRKCSTILIEKDYPIFYF